MSTCIAEISLSDTEEVFDARLEDTTSFFRFGIGLLKGLEKFNSSYKTTATIPQNELEGLHD